MKYIKSGTLLLALEEIEAILEKYQLTLRVTYPNCLTLVNKDGKEFQIKNTEDGKETQELPRIFYTERIITED